MSKITQVTIINSSKIRLDVDAKSGDEIDLLELSKIDNAILQIKLNEKIQNEFNNKVNAEKKKLEITIRDEISKEIDKYKEDIIKLNEANRNLKDTITSELNVKHLKEVQELQNRIAQLNYENETIKKEKVNEIKLAEATTKEQYTTRIKELESSLEIFKLQADKEKKEELDELKESYEEKLKKQTQEINDLKLAKSSLNVKRLGEELESWCNNEYDNYAQCGFENCTWQKDNISIKEDGESKGTKADYIFKVYASNNLLEEELLTSVACEMKNESPNSINKKKNADHFAKLDKDRNKKKCEYALLISELEWDQPNDIPIRKVAGYEKMYIVRPQYFITFLSIIMNISMKYKSLILEEIKTKESFKDATIIKEEFEKFKTNIVDKSLEKLENELKDSTENAKKIKTLADKIIDTNNELIDKTITNMKNKIEKFNIDKLTKKINKYNQEFND